MVRYKGLACVEYGGSLTLSRSHQEKLKKRPGVLATLYVDCSYLPKALFLHQSGPTAFLLKQAIPALFLTRFLYCLVFAHSFLMLNISGYFHVSRLGVKKWMYLKMLSRQSTVVRLNTIRPSVFSFQFKK